MQVRHDTSLLEKAIEQVLLRASIPTLQAQAEALEKTNKAVAIRRSQLEQPSHWSRSVLASGSSSPSTGI